MQPPRLEFKNIFTRVGDLSRSPPISQAACSRKSAEHRISPKYGLACKAGVLYNLLSVAKDLQ